jgi:hypothetical protein
MAVLLAPAKRASVSMFVLSGLLIPCGLLLGLLFAAFSNMDLSKLPAENSAQIRLAEQQLGQLGMTVPGFLLGAGLTTLIIGVLLLILGVLVRRGGLGSAVTSIIVCCMLALGAVLSVVGGVSGSAQGQGEAVIGTCVWGILLVVLIFTLVWLFQAARNSGHVAAYRMGYQNQMQQYQQYGQMYPPQHPSQQPQNWQQPGQGQWGQPAWPPQPPQQQQNWPPPPPPPSPPGDAT